MGYAGNALDDQGGAVLTAPQFLTVGKADIALDNISLIPPEGMEVADLSGNIEIQTLNNDGSSGDEDYLWDGTQWIDGWGEPVSGVTFAAGKGLWVYNYLGDVVNFRSAGEVNTSDIKIALDLEGGAVAVVNAYPVEVALDGFLLEADESIDLSGNIEIQTLNNDGSTGDEDYLWDGTQWVDGWGEPVSDVKFAAGKGLWVYNYSGCEVYLRIPAPTSNL